MPPQRRIRIVGSGVFGLWCANGRVFTHCVDATDADEASPPNENAAVSPSATPGHLRMCVGGEVPSSWGGRATINGDSMMDPLHASFEQATPTFLKNTYTNLIGMVTYNFLSANTPLADHSAPAYASSRKSVAARLR